MLRRAASRLAIRGLLGSMWILRRIDGKLLGTSALRSAADFRRDPYPSWELIRDKGPVLRTYANRGWLVIGQQAAQEILRSPDFSNDIQRGRFITSVLRAATEGEPVPFLDHPPLLNQDPPAHTRLRKLVSEGFTQRYINSLAPFIEQCIDGLLRDIPPGEPVDMVSALAEPLPVMVITKMMGVPDEHRGRFVRWSHELTGATLIAQPEMVARASRAEREMRDYLNDLVAQKVREPGDDFISRLAQAQEADDHLTREEIIATCILLLSAGHETTTRLIGSGLYLLLTHPAQLAELRHDRGLLPGAIEEMLRFEPPIQMTVRFVARRTRIDGRLMHPGQMVMISLGAANRDPAAYEQPQQFDIHRAPGRHVAFGYGIHLCLGLALARLEARLAFNALLDRFSGIELIDRAPAWQGNPFFRGLEHLNVRLVSPDSY